MKGELIKIASDSEDQKTNSDLRINLIHYGILHSDKNSGPIVLQNLLACTFLQRYFSFLTAPLYVSSHSAILSFLTALL